MSLVSHVATCICQHGATSRHNHDTNGKKKTVNIQNKQTSKYIQENKTANEELNEIEESKYAIQKTQNADDKTAKTESNKIEKGTNSANVQKRTANNVLENVAAYKEKIIDDKNLNINFNKETGLANDIIPDEKGTVNSIFEKSEAFEKHQQRFAKRALGKTRVNQKLFEKRKNHKIVAKRTFKKEIQQRLNEPHWKINNNTGNALVRGTNIFFKRRPKWGSNSGVLISLVILNIAGLSSAMDTSDFSSALTSRMIASFLGYPSTCNLGTEVRPCTLTLSCWLRGGTRLRGCGGWLFSCCGPPEPSFEGFDNSIPSSDWKYKTPPKLRQVPQRSVLPNNVFRRRVDDDVSQIDCGLPSSRILQKRIIGGREARFAEFPWQAHVRISEFQCGGVLVSRWYVATAAHCVSRAHTRDIVVWLGAVDTSATHYPARKLGVVKKILHPLFQFRMTQPDRYDIALLKLSRPITYMSHILPICLPDYDMELRGRSGVIAGWGKTDATNSHTGTNLLRSATVPILSKEQCINWHQSKQISVEIHSEMICAGHSDGHQDACLGDSGGPLIVLDNGRYYLVGITSAGFGCGVDHQPGIYHNVKVTANWIRGVISPSVNYIDV